jgi:hypothetical protein
MGVDPKQDAKWLFSQEKATSQAPQKVYMYSENALPCSTGAILGSACCFRAG